MSNDERQNRWIAYSQQPFVPAGPNVSAEHRVANALEYIAAQLGHINAKLDRLAPKAPDGGEF